MQAQDEAIRQCIYDVITHKKRLESYYEASREDSFFQLLARLSGHHIDYLDEMVAFNPVNYLSTCLPFIDTRHPDSLATGLQKISSEVVVGSHHTEYPVNEDSERPYVKEAFERVKECNEAARKLPKETLYYRVGRLPLYFAAAGKNRVSLAQRIRASLFGRVIELPFPQASELSIHKVRPFNVYILKCTDERFSTDPDMRVLGGQIIPYPGTYLPLLYAYGVKDGKSHWSPSAGIKYLKARKRAISILDGRTVEHSEFL